MVDLKLMERECFKFLKMKFEKVEWLSRNSYSPIDFKCYKNGIEFLIEGKYCVNGKVYLSPNQHKVDAVAIHDGKKTRLLWRKDFGGFVILSKSSVIKLSNDLKQRLDRIKLHKRETYSEVIERLYNKHTLI